jgi:putative ABC transport system substrate-binding protein
MKRRDLLIVGLAVASVTAVNAVASRAATAQRPARTYRLGFLTTTSGPADRHLAFETALRDLGYREGDNLTIERRYAAGHLDRLPSLADDLVRAEVDVIVTETTPSALAAKRATTKIPIVMATGGDAVGSGLVASLARPGGNVTGMTFLGPELVTKKLELLRELKPEMRRVAWFGNAGIAPEQRGFPALESAAAAFGIDAVFAHAPVPEDFESSFATMAATGVDAVIVAENAVNTDRRTEIVALAARHRLAAIYGRREFVVAGGALSHGANFAELFSGAAFFVDRILQGADPADLPVRLPMKFEVVINLKAAGAAGLTVPKSLLARADEVIE